MTYLISFYSFQHTIQIQLQVVRNFKLQNRIVQNIINCGKTQILIIFLFISMFLNETGRVVHPGGAGARPGRGSAPYGDQETGWEKKGSEEDDEGTNQQGTVHTGK